MESCLFIECAANMMPDIDMNDVRFGQLMALATGLSATILARLVYLLLST